MFKQLPLVLLVLTILSCTSKSEHDEELMSKAYKKQKEVIQLIGIIEDQLEGYENQSKDSLMTVIEQMEETIFEIPGYQLELPGHEGHDHSHDHSEVALTDQEIYDVQVEMLKELQSLQKFISKQ